MGSAPTPAGELGVDGVDRDQGTDRRGPGSGRGTQGQEGLTSEEGAPEAPLVFQQMQRKGVSMKKPVRSASSDPSKKDWVKVLEEATPEQWAKARKEAEEELIRRAGKTVQVFPVND